MLENIIINNRFYNICSKDLFSGIYFFVKMFIRVTARITSLSDGM